MAFDARHCLMSDGICTQVRERCPTLVRECHMLLPLLEEMEKHITAFYQSLERASCITSAARDPNTQIWSQQKQQWQVRYNHNVTNRLNLTSFTNVNYLPLLNLSLFIGTEARTLSLKKDLLNQQQSCKRSLSVVERNYHTLQKALSTSKVFRNLDLFLLHKRVAEIQSSAKVSV